MLRLREERLRERWPTRRERLPLFFRLWLRLRSRLEPRFGVAERFCGDVDERFFACFLDRVRDRRRLAEELDDPPRFRLAPLRFFEERPRSTEPGAFGLRERRLLRPRFLLRRLLELSLLVPLALLLLAPRLFFVDVCLGCTRLFFAASGSALLLALLLLLRLSLFLRFVLLLTLAGLASDALSGSQGCRLLAFLTSSLSVVSFFIIAPRFF